MRTRSTTVPLTRGDRRGDPRLTPLPIDGLLPGIVAELGRGPSLVIEAPPGAGKTTRVPPALLPLVRGEVLVLEPRRLAARTIRRFWARVTLASRRSRFGYGLAALSACGMENS